LSTAWGAPPNPRHHQFDRRNNQIHWGSCAHLGVNNTDYLFCGNLAVPLDYTHDSAAEMLDIQLMRIPAAKTPKRGSVFMNFGGPGGSGILEMAYYGRLFRMHVM
jgi:hypothetical protein